MPISIVDRGVRNRVSIPESVRAAQTATILLEGDDNTVVIGEGATVQAAGIHFGSGCSLECGRDCRLGSIEVYALRDGHVRIGDGTVFMAHCRIYLHEAGEIAFGKGCLVAGGTTLSVSDMHSIVDVKTGRRLNPPRNIRIGDRVWLGDAARVWKGATIGDGSIVGIGSLVTKDVPAESIAAGVPARVIRTGVTWRHELLPPEHPAGKDDAGAAAVPPPAAVPAGPGGPATPESVRFLAGRLSPDPERFVTTIDPRDDVFLFGRHHYRDDEVATLAYFRYGSWAAAEIGQIAEWRFGGLGQVPRLLEFACGHGRQTRYLAQGMPPERIWCSDFDAAAVDFVRSTFGVRGFVSSPFPGGIRCDERFDLITAVSLFSRLPRHTFTMLLDRLLSLLAPGGVLVFSVHDVLWCPAASVGEDGFAFIPHVQNSVDHGTTYVTEDFVRRCLRASGGGSRPCVRLPRGLCSHEDLYVVGADDSVRPECLAFRRGPEGCLGACERTPAGSLELSGWAGDPDAADGAARVEVRIDGRPVGSPEAGIPRPDVASLLGEPRYARAGWRCVLEPEAVGGAGAMLEVVAVAGDGRSRVLHAGRLQAIVGARLC